MKKQFLKEVKQFQKIAGVLKEYIESDPETITQAFQKAGIDLSKPVVYIVDYGSPNAVDTPVKTLGGKLLQQLEAERKRDEAADPDYNEESGITYDYDDMITQGQGELLGDDLPATKGLKCKLNVYFSDSHIYEIWQADEINEEDEDGDDEWANVPNTVEGWVDYLYKKASPKQKAKLISIYRHEMENEEVTDAYEFFTDLIDSSDPDAIIDLKDLNQYSGY